jgi:hypothetical protein
MTTRKSKRFIHEGKCVAEVSVELIEDDTAWSPYLCPDEVRKLDTVCLALRRGDVSDAANTDRYSGSLRWRRSEKTANSSW